MSKVYSLKAIQKIPIDITTAWDFFSKPANLNSITPAKLDFKITGLYKPDEMYAGQIIEYILKPIAGIPVYWMTEIRHVQHEKYFIDEQRFGPYSLWHHQHHFKQLDDTIEMTDLVHYKIPYWFIGDIANTILVRKELKKIFEYRFKKIEGMFGKVEGQQCYIEMR